MVAALSPHSQVLSALICEPESRSAGIVGTFSFLLFNSFCLLSSLERGGDGEIYLCVCKSRRTCAAGRMSERNERAINIIQAKECFH